MAKTTKRRSKKNQRFSPPVMRFLNAVQAIGLALGLFIVCTTIFTFSLINFIENKFHSSMTYKLLAKNMQLNQTIEEQYTRFSTLYSEYLENVNKNEQLQYQLEKNLSLKEVLSNKLTILSKIKSFNDRKKDVYIVVSTSENKLWLRRGRVTLKTFKIATGFKSYQYDDAAKITRHVSITPKTVFNVRKLVKNPVWIKPDWYFTEKGLSIPPIDSPLRRDKKALGPYGIYLQDRYIIHGYTSKRDLGRNVSHGCIRMAPKDLKIVYDNVKIKTEVYIY